MGVANSNEGVKNGDAKCRGKLGCESRTVCRYYFTNKGKPASTVLLRLMLLLTEL